MYMAREFMYVHKLNFKEVHTHDCARTYPQMAYGPGRTQANNVMCGAQNEIEKRDQGKSDREWDGICDRTRERLDGMICRYTKTTHEIIKLR